MLVIACSDGCVSLVAQASLLTAAGILTGSGSAFGLFLVWLHWSGVKKGAASDGK